MALLHHVLIFDQTPHSCLWLINPLCARNTWIHPNLVDVKANDALAPDVARSSSAKTLTTSDKYVLVLYLFRVAFNNICHMNIQGWYIIYGLDIVFSPKRYSILQSVNFQWIALKLLLLIRNIENCDLLQITFSIIRLAAFCDLRTISMS